MAENTGISGRGGVLARKLARARGFGTADTLADTAAIGDDLGAMAGAFASAAPDPHLRAWRLALARAARDQLKMTVGFEDVAQRQASLTEVLETPMQRALILMLQGPGDEMGLMVLSGQMLAAMIEILTLTHLAKTAPDAADLRKPTRTDAAMTVEFVDAALTSFEAILTENSALPGDWAAGYRYAAFIDDPRPLHLMLEDGDFQLLSASLVLEDGARHGEIWLALPLRPALPIMDFGPSDFTADAALALPNDNFSADLAAQVQEMPAQLDASLTQIALPLERLMSLQVGEILELPLANLDHIDLCALDGCQVARARLGQNRGMRALRLTDLAFAHGSVAGQKDNLATAAQANAAGQPLPPAPPDDIATMDAAAQNMTLDLGALDQDALDTAMPEAIGA